MIATVLTVLRKELREAIRDRRSLGSSLFYGVWGPLVMALAVNAIARDRSTNEPIAVPAEGQERAPALAQFLGARGISLDPAPARMAERIRTREVPVAMVIEENFPADFSASRPAALTLLYDSAHPRSKARADRIKAAIADYSRQVAATRLVVRGVGPAVTSAIDLQERDLATASARAALAVATLPIFVLLAAFVGGMGVAADATAGERERASLEPLLLYPVPRGAIATAKWAAAAALAIATTTVTVIVTAGVLRHPRIQGIDLPIGLSPGEAARVWGIMVPLALCAPALQTLIGLLSRTFKEANTHLSLLIFAPMIPGFLFALGTVPAQPWMAWTPVVGQHLMIASVVRGETILTADYLALAAFSVAAAAIAIAATTRLLDGDAILRDGGS